LFNKLKIMFNSEPNSFVNLEETEVFVFPTSFAQARLLFIDQLIPGNTFYNVPTVIHLTGFLNLSALEQTWQKIVDRHEILRTTFKFINDQPVQIIASNLAINLPVIDLQNLPLLTQKTETQKLITAEFEHQFDLSQLPLIRAKLIKLNPTEQILLLNLHHIICDDWSMGILIKELGSLYTSFSQNQTPNLLELPLQYADFAHWQRETLTGEILENHLAYWRQKLSHISELNLPTDQPKTDINNYQGATAFLELPKSLSDALETLTQQENATLFMTLLAAFQILLYHYTHQEDIAVGSVIANRNRSEIEQLIGFFVNTLVLRTDLSGNPNFREVLHRVKETTLGAYAHQDLPFEKLVEELHPERNLNQHPLFQVMFGFQNSPMQSLELPGLEVKTLDLELTTTRFDLEFHLWQSSDNFRSLWGGNRWQYTEGIRGVMVYNTDLFAPSTITRMLKHFQTLIESIIANPEQRITELEILTQSEQHQISVKFNQTQSNYPKNNCIHQLFIEQVKQNPDSIAINFNQQQLTYQELSDRSNQLARYLQKKGAHKEENIAICIEPSVEMIVGLLGILKAGSAYLPLDPNYPQERLNFMLEDAQISLLLTTQNLSESFINYPLINLDKDWQIIAQESQENLENNATSENLAYIIYTSGSTGKPKGVAVTHQAVNRLVCQTNYVKIQASDKIAQVSNFSFDAATFEIWGALLNGAQLIGINREVLLSPEDFSLEIRQKEISILFLTTALFQQMARTTPNAFANLRYLLFGGETVAPRWVKKVLAKAPPKQLIHVYGPTENTTFSTYYNIEEVGETATSIPIGYPISNTQVYILNAQLKPVPIGVIGELYLGGDGLAKGYLNQAELTAERFIKNPFNSQPKARLYKTGDLAKFQPDGKIEFVGRIDNQVKIRGFRIELGEIEVTLSQHDQVTEVVVIVNEDIPGDKHLIAYIVPEQNQTPNSRNLREFLKAKLPEYMVPSAFVFLETLPLTANGKVDRKALPLVDTLSLDITENYVAPRTEIEQVLTETFAQVLGKEQVGIHDNFFELGGHSLLATQVTSRIRDKLQIEVPVRNLFTAPTAASLAKYLETVSWVAKGQQVNNLTEDTREEVEF
jgi:amino acid adenylation domain-containing protein